MSRERSHLGFSSFGGKLYVFGGGGLNFQSLQASETYDPAADQWTPLPPMPTFRSGLVALSLGERIYAMGGGYKNPDGTFSFLTVVETFSPASLSWETGPPLIQRHDAPAATLHRDSIYLFGGHNPEAKEGPLTDPALSFSEKLEFGQTAWREISPLPTPRFSLGAVAMGNAIWALGGGAFKAGRFQNFNRIEVFYPDSGEWETPAALELPWSSAGIGALTVGEKLFVFGGNDGTGISKRAAFYDPSVRKWEELDPMPEPRAAMSVAVIGKTIYLAGGRDATGKSPVSSLLAYDLP